MVPSCVCIPFPYLSPPFSEIRPSHTAFGEVVVRSTGWGNRKEGCSAHARALTPRAVVLMGVGMQGSRGY